MTELAPDLLARHRADVANGMFAAVRRLRWPAGRLAAERERRLRELLVWSIERSPFHAERLAGIDIERFTEADLTSLPVMTKNDLMGDFDRVVTDPALTLDVVNERVSDLDTDEYLLDRYRVVATSGTTGARGLFVYDWDQWTTFVVMATRWQGRDGNTFLPDAPVATLFASETLHVSGALHAFFRDSGSRDSSGSHSRLTHLPPSMALPEIVAALNANPPVVLQGYPTSMRLLAMETKAGRLTIHPQRVVTCGEQCTEETRAAVAEVWGVEIYDYWGCSEGAYAFPCEARNGKHLPDDLVIVEPVDEHGDPVGDGEQCAKILVTNLYNRTQPLVRYEVSDRMTITAEPCACGCAHRRITEIHGRPDTFFTYDNGAVVHEITMETVLLSQPLAGYQVTQTPRGAAIQIILQGAVDLEGLRRRVTDLMARSGLADPQVEVEAVDDLDRLWSGKVTKFRPL